jgi:general secretion pathway protein L
MNKIEELQSELSQWYEASSIHQFMHWWKTGLKSFVPEKYQESLFPQTIKIYLTQGEQGVDVWYKKGTTFVKYTASTTEEDETEQWWHQVQHIINEADGRKVTVEYLLPNNEALVRKIALPQAAKENLEEVIGFELDKYVPFNSEQVQLGYKIDSKNSNKDKLLMDLAVIPKHKVTEVLSLCDEKSISLDGIDVNLKELGSTPDYLGINLLPVEKRKPGDYGNLKLNLGLAVVVVGLLYFVMYTSVTNKQSKIERLTEINTQLQKDARTAKLLKKELKSVIVSSKFLQTQKAKHPPLVTLMAEATTILPDDTYLTRLKVNQDSIELAGQSENASSLIPKLNQSEKWYAPQIVGPVTPDPRTNKEKFTIKADLNEPKPEDEDGNNS